MDATDIATCEQKIVDRLKAKVPGVAVEPFPDKPENYRLTHQVGTLLPAYGGATYGATQDTSDVVQERQLEFDVTILVRQLRGHQGAYVYLEAVRLALTGYRIPGCGKLRPVREKFLSQGAGVWTYVSRFALVTIAVEPDEDETVHPALSGITVTSDFNTSEITP